MTIYNCKEIKVFLPFQIRMRRKNIRVLYFCHGKKVSFYSIFILLPFKAVLFYYLYGNWCDLAILFKRKILNKQKQQQQTSMLLEMISEKTHIENTFIVIAMQTKVFILRVLLRIYKFVLCKKRCLKNCFRYVLQVTRTNTAKNEKKKIKSSSQKDNPSSGNRNLFHFLNI